VRRRIEDQARVCVLASYELIDGDLTVAACLEDLEDALRTEVGNAALADQVGALARRHQARLVTDQDVEYALRTWSEIGAASEPW
jgi:sirohydrochlorin ferrochelatase